jgi:lactoylglutathione lyase
MLKFNGIDHINMNVRNLEKSVSFYQDVFGFEVKEEGEYFSPAAKRNIVFKIIGKSDKGMLALYEQKDLVQKSHINHLGFHISNFSIEQAQLLHDKKIPVQYFDELGGVVEYKNSHSIYIEDPDGNGIEVSSVFGGGL